MSWCNLILTERAQRFILVVIIVNAITLGLETSAGAMAAAGGLLTFLDRLALLIFVIELAMKMAALRGAFVRDAWNVFDFLVVAIAFVPSGAGFAVLRSLRVLRVLRLVSSLPRLRVLVQSMLLSLPSIGWISLLMLVIFYIFAVMATKIFGPAFPEWFGTLGETFYTLFQVMTLESWSMGIARPVMETFPAAWIFFVPFVLLSSFVVLNLFIAIIVNGMSDAREEARAERPESADADLHEEMARLRAQMEKVDALIRRREEMRQEK